MAAPFRRFAARDRGTGGLANDPDIILAVEPTGNLDTKSGTEILDLFDSLHQRGKTLIFVTHDEKLADHAKRIIRLLDGSIHQDYRASEPECALTPPLS